MQRFYDLLRSTSRTFAVGIESLPGALRDAVTLAYLVLRVSDYYEDSPSLSDPERREALDHWARLVRSPSRPTRETELAALIGSVRAEDRELPDHRAARHAAEILEALAALPPPFGEPIREHTAATTLGMARWAARGDDFPDEAALDDYMFEVAGRVGLLLTDLFTAYSPAIRARRNGLGARAVSFGLGLQTVNVIRGLHEDPARGWSFIPRDLFPAGASSGPGASRSDPDPRTLPSAARSAVLDFLVAKAGRHIGDALDYCRTLPRRERGIRIFCIIPALLASRTAALSRGNPRVFREPVKLSRNDVRRVVVASRLLFFSDLWLERERRRALALISPPPP